jgi:hypothetical protein
MKEKQRSKDRTMQASSGAVSVRPATEGDATFLSWVLLEASRSSLPRGFYDVLFDGCGDEAELLAILKELVLTPEPSFTRWDCFFIAEIDGIHAGGRPPFLPPSNHSTDARSLQPLAALLPRRRRERASGARS